MDLPLHKKLCSPIAKTFKRLHNGIEDGLPYCHAPPIFPTYLSRENVESDMI